MYTSFFDPHFTRYFRWPIWVYIGYVTDLLKLDTFSFIKFLVFPRVFSTTLNVEKCHLLWLKVVSIRWTWFCLDDSFWLDWVPDSRNTNKMTKNGSRLIPYQIRMSLSHEGLGVWTLTLSVEVSNVKISSLCRPEFRPTISTHFSLWNNNDHFTYLHNFDTY